MYNYDLPRTIEEIEEWINEKRKTHTEDEVKMLIREQMTLISCDKIVLNRMREQLLSGGEVW